MRSSIGNGVRTHTITPKKTDEGARGAQGAQGRMGPQGYQGGDGERGQQGMRGERGAQGHIGDHGEIGDRGEPGATGRMGDAGLNGAQGAQGYQGAVGGTGAQGAQGVRGAPGDRGGVVVLTESKYVMTPGDKFILVVVDGDVMISAPPGAEGHAFTIQDVSGSGTLTLAGLVGMTVNGDPFFEVKRAGLYAWSFWSDGTNLWQSSGWKTAPTRKR